MAGKKRLPKQSKDKESGKDTEELRGIIRKQTKIINALKKENARLTKHIDTRYEMLEDHVTDTESPDLDFSGWRCQKCKHDKCDELVLPHANGHTKVYRTCKKCGHKERTEHGSEQDNATLDTQRQQMANRN